jgi:membrane fusion protein (multidrug efflux system)
LRYSYCTIRAPFDGRVTSRNVDLGQTVRIGTPLFRVEDTSPLLCKIYLPSNLVSSIAEGQAAEIVAKGLSDSTLTGRVRMISPIVDPMTGTVKVTVEVDGSGNPVRSGSFVEVRMITDIHNGVPAVPKKAILSEGGELYVFAAGSDTVRRVRVTTGYEQDDLVEVVSGLHSGDSVVVVGHGGIEEGTKIKAMKGPGSASSAADSALADSLSGGTAPGVGGAPADSVAQSSISDSEQNQGDTQ